jgi:hypothetical protein
MTFERKPFQVHSDEFWVDYTPEQNTDMWVVTVLTPHDEFKGGLPIFDKLQDNSTVERDYNYFSSLWQDYDVSVLV